MVMLREGTGLSPARAKDLLAVASVADGLVVFRVPLPAGAAQGRGQVRRARGRALRGGGGGAARAPYVAAIMTSYLRRDADGEAAIGSSRSPSSRPSTGSTGRATRPRDQRSAS